MYFYWNKFENGTRLEMEHIALRFLSRRSLLDPCLAFREPLESRGFLDSQKVLASNNSSGGGGRLYRLSKHAMASKWGACLAISASDLKSNPRNNCLKVGFTCLNTLETFPSSVSFGLPCGTASQLRG